jgi:hypothetical protein
VIKKTPKLFHPKFHLTNSKYSEKNSYFIYKNFEIIYAFTLVHLIQYRFLPIISKQTLQSNGNHPEKNNCFLLGCMEKGTIYTVIGNVSKCHHCGYQYGVSSKIKNKTKIRST